MNQVVTSYREILRNELAKRCQKNPKYSLRAFSRDLQISPSRLTHILKDNFGLSKSAALEIATRLGWNAQESQHFADLVESEHGRSQAKRKLAQARLEEKKGSFRDLDVDQYHSISDWYHFAILELCDLEGFNKSPRNSKPAQLGRLLGISMHEAHAAVNRLTRMGLLQEKKGILSGTGKTSLNPNGIPSQAIRKSHQGILERASRALDVQTVDERDSSAMTMAIDLKDLPEAKAFIRDFRRQFDKKFSVSAKSKNRVYCLAVHLFKLQEKDLNEEKDNV